MLRDLYNKHMCAVCCARCCVALGRRAVRAATPPPRRVRVGVPRRSRGAARCAARLAWGCLFFGAAGRWRRRPACVYSHTSTLYFSQSAKRTRVLHFVLRSSADLISISHPSSYHHPHRISISLRVRGSRARALQLQLL